MSLEDIAEKMKTRMNGFNHTAKFDFDSDGIMFVDATQSPPVITFEDKEAEVTLTTSLETFEKIVRGDQDPNIAFMMGKLKVTGDMSVAMRLQRVI